MIVHAIQLIKAADASCLLQEAKGIAIALAVFSMRTTSMWPGVTSRDELCHLGHEKQRWKQKQCKLPFQAILKFHATLIFCSHQSKNVQAQTPGALWAVDRSTFRSIIVDSMIRKREHHEELLSNMKVFSTLTAENRAAIADCLVQETYEVSLTYQRHHRRAVVGI